MTLESQLSAHNQLGDLPAQRSGWLDLLFVRAKFITTVMNWSSYMLQMFEYYLVEDSILFVENQF